MPKQVLCPKPVRDALFACFRALTRLVHPEQRLQLVLKSEDLDVVSAPSIIATILESVMAGTASFGVEADGKISFDAAQGLKVHVDFISLGDESVIEHIYETEAFYERSVASLPDLLRGASRAVFACVGPTGYSGCSMR
ncbi:uncharacterized protein PgNI_00204 [Pyricularia grisea]|uniref:Uncharacterized protein n=1 Tax=Pyricularia grisea TaxID=148305 RepID=A0A6P8BGW2_PYRGI|nr:uncharacterized protein PgNI_00204 [Pyricularia grisea]TLD16106.1 hypothetical protein PgNI_00204 [Pyricularia grisea]